MKRFLVAATLLISTNLAAQQMAPDVPNNTGPLPDTDIYLADLVKTNSSFQINSPRNITNYKGYDNQPYFLPDSSAILYTSEDADVRTDIWQYTVKSGQKTQLTNTPNNSEFSPKIMPDGSGFSVIREQEFRGGQQVWRYQFGNATDAERMLELSPTGYHAWGMGLWYLAVFVLGEPATLQLANRETGTSKIIFENIGRGLFSLPDSSGYTFTEPRGDNPVLVHHYDIASDKLAPLFELPAGNEFYALMKNDAAPLGVSFFSASGSKIYYRESSDKAWHEIANLNNSGIRSISRLAISPNGKHIAIVAAE